jgi:carbonic anhydrase/acetyltransferase-like protein (isoleucine patch superfamily)
VVAAAALVPEGAVIPPHSMAMGVPAKVRRQITEEEAERFRLNAQHYVEAGQIYRGEQSK